MKILGSFLLACVFSMTAYASPSAEGATSANVVPSPYGKALVTIFEDNDGGEKLLASKVVLVQDHLKVSEHTDSVDYTKQCARMNNQTSECIKGSTPVGLQAGVQYMETAQGNAPTYRMKLKWSELVALNTIEHNGLTIELPQVNSIEMVQEFSYKKPVEFRGKTSVKGQKTNTIVRVQLLQ